MRLIAQERADLIEALSAEAALEGLTAALLEKDEHLTDALRAVCALKFEHVELVFCGGTSLSKAHGLIERMSEDADFKIVLTGTGRAMSRTRLRRYLGDVVREQLARALSRIGLVEQRAQAVSLNEHRYLLSHRAYRRRYPATAGLRPHLQFELTLRAPLLPCEGSVLVALADRLAGRTGAPFVAQTISVAETQAEKVLSFLRRFAHHAASSSPAWDVTLVRHIYDVHAIHRHDPGLAAAGARAFAALVAGDAAEFGRQQPAFAADPFGLLESALARAGGDPLIRDEYHHHLLPLVYGDSRPPFDEAFASFAAVARQFLRVVEKAS